MKRVVALPAVAVLAACLAAACGKPLTASDVAGTYRVSGPAGEYLQVTLTPAGYWDISKHATAKPAQRLSSGAYRLDGEKVLFTFDGKSGQAVGHLDSHDLVVIDVDGRTSRWVPQ